MFLPRDSIFHDHGQIMSIILYLCMHNRIFAVVESVYILCIIRDLFFLSNLISSTWTKLGLETWIFLFSLFDRQCL